VRRLDAAMPGPLRERVADCTSLNGLSALWSITSKVFVGEAPCEWITAGKTASNHLPVAR